MPLAAIFFSPLIVVIWLVSLVLFVVALVDMVRRPDWQWKQAGSSKAMWLVLEIALFVLFGFLSIVSSIVYLVAARPKLVAAEKAGDTSSRQGYQWDSGYRGGSGYGTSWGGGAHGTPSGPYEPSPGAGPPPYPGTGPPPYPGSPGSPGSAGAEQPAAESGAEGAAVSASPSWQPDPSRRHEFRYWDGTQWTEYVSDGGVQSTDPPTP